MNVLNNREYSSQVLTTPEDPSSSSSINNYSRAYGEQYQQFCERHLPLPQSSDATALSEGDYARALSIASSSKCTALMLGEDLPNEAANPERIGIERIMELRDGLDTICSHWQDMCGDDRNILQLAALTLSRLCKGGGEATSEGSHTESASQGSHHVTGYTGSGQDSRIVTGWGRGGGFEEQPTSNAQRDISVGMFAPPTTDNTLPSAISQFNPNTRDQPSHSLEEEEEEEVYERDEFPEPSFQAQPTEETVASSLPSNPVMEETQLGRDRKSVV